jgi:Fic family protein
MNSTTKVYANRVAEARWGTPERSTTAPGDALLPRGSEIEGETLDAEQVRSSIARRLGLDIGALKPADRHVEGIVEIVLDATRRFDKPLTAERLFAWHASLFPTGRSGMTRIRTEAWHDDSRGPMQVKGA